MTRSSDTLGSRTLASTAGAFSSADIVTAIYAGALFGLIDAAAIASGKTTTDQIAFIPLRLWAIVPMLWIGLCAGGVAILLLARLRRIALSAVVSAAVALLITVRCIVPVRFYWPSHFSGVAIPLMAVASAVVAGAWRLARRVRLRERSLGAALAGWSAFAVLIFLSCARLSPQRLESSAEGAGRPNIVLIFLDTLRYDASGLDGIIANAPNLASFGRGGRVYENAYATFPWTLPSHVAVLTGHEADTTRVGFFDQTYRGERATLAEAAHRKGYATIGYFSNPFLNPGSGLQRGFESFEYSQNDLDVCRSSVGFLLKMVPNVRGRVCRLTADDIAEKAVEIVKSAPRPYFLALNFMDAHLPLYVPRSYRPSAYHPFRPASDYPLFDEARSGRPIPKTAIENYHRNYNVAVHYLDNRLGYLLRAVEATPDGSNTIVAIVGDHGEQFGEHGLLMHGNSVYRQVLHVPLALRGPSIPPQRISQPVSIPWLYGTLLRATGTSSRELPVLPESSGPAKTPVLSLHEGSRRDFGDRTSRITLRSWSVFRDAAHFILHENGAEELYDIERDPAETRNLIGDIAQTAERDQLRAIILNRFPKDGVNQEGLRRLRSLGYMQ
jgi:arylsulfatase A-like enzyme